MVIRACHESEISIHLYLIVFTIRYAGSEQMYGNFIYQGFNHSTTSLNLPWAWHSSAPACWCILSKVAQPE